MGVDENGNAKTIVITEEGCKKAFGETTVHSLLDSSQSQTTDFIEKLSDHQLRGLAHEMGQRLVEQSQSYHVYLKELQKYQERMGFEYFGLPKDATEKQLDNAYRSLAKKMHPDKNGGTEEAKKRFQNMKDRYEKLEERIREEPNRGGGQNAGRDDERHR